MTEIPDVHGWHHRDRLRELASNANLIPIVVLILGGFVSAFALGLIPIVVFPEETIEIVINQEFIEVNASYDYTNPCPFPITQGFQLPFPAELPDPEIVRVSIADQMDPIFVRQGFGGRIFEVRFAANETIRVNLYYKQSTPLHAARYILKTTKDWYRPLSKAYYILRCNAGVAGVRSNYSLYKDGPVWKWNRANFMPKKDWIISWANTEI